MMKLLSKISGLAGLLLAAWAVIGRFRGPPTLSAFDDYFAASSALLLANTFLLLALLLRPRAK